jgi:cytochrome P450
MTVRRNHEKHIAESQAVDPMLGEGNIVTAEGARWKRLHKMIAPAFSITYVTNLRPMVGKNVMEFRVLLQQLAQTGEPFNLEHYVERLAVDIIGTAVFGHSFNAQATGSSVMDYFRIMCRANIQERDGFWFDFVRNCLARWKRVAASKKLSVGLTELIERRFDYAQNNDSSLEDRGDSTILDIILRYDLQKTPQTERKGTNPGILEDALIQVRALTIGGSGTIADTISFAYMLLSAHPEVVRKLREEHDQIFAPGIDATYDLLCSDPYRLNQLEYTTNVVKETLRMYPVGPTARREHSDGFLEYEGKRWTTKGCMVVPVQLAMHMNPDIFPNPKAFDPDRYKREDFVRHAWRPFERGPRACLGQPLAMDEAKIILLLTIREFDFTCVNVKPNQTPRVLWTDLDLIFGDRAFQEFVFEAKPRDGMLMRVKRSSWN